MIFFLLFLQRLERNVKALCNIVEGRYTGISFTYNVYSYSIKLQ